MNRHTATLLSLLFTVISFASFAFACPFSAEEKCSVGKESCGSKDHLDVSEAEIKLLGKDTFHANIAMIEKALKERGVNLPEQGFVTSDFRSALISFQESAGLKSTGEINQETLDKLGVKF